MTRNPDDTGLDSGMCAAGAVRTVYIVDDEPLVCDALAELVGLDGWRAETFSCADDFLAVCAGVDGGCLLLDLFLPEMSGLELHEAIHQQSEKFAVILMSGRGSIPAVVEAMRLGAIDFLEKPFGRDALRTALERGRAYLMERATVAAARDAAAARFSKLTSREREVMKLMLKGHQNKEIAWMLGISQRTAESHRAHVMTKSDTRNLAQLLQLFSASGLTLD